MQRERAADSASNEGRYGACRALGPAWRRRDKQQRGWRQVGLGGLWGGVFWVSANFALAYYVKLLGTSLVPMSGKRAAVSMAGGAWRSTVRYGTRWKITGTSKGDSMHLSCRSMVTGG
ncbi:predicted protein [Histoplasma capsulatum var. duboisii H88]|uniref:Predicted protein n=1 Tax=Ajellomyces capsulatus (strain H88) TaxID=544711 RepID=F0UB61_AJEC8|nr:predicted protein [Histoplasma capsulatum var. duboisii H88]